MYKIILLTLLFFLINTYSFAYLGPGVGGGMMAATLGIIFALLAAIFGLIWFPLKRLLKKRRQEKNQQQNKVD